MIVLYNGCHTSFDVMKEYMIYGAELDEKYQIPIVPACSLDYLPEDSIDFGESFSQKIKGHRKLNVNFYIDDSKFQRLWNNPDKYLEHLKCFHSVCMPDFSIATGDCGMPFALNLYNVYRNHALAHYMLLHGNVTVQARRWMKIHRVLELKKLTILYLTMRTENRISGSW